jgi:hypothetical protein
MFASFEVGWDPARLQAPVLVVMGRHDYVVPPPLWDDALAGLGTGTGAGHVTYRVLERSGHTPQLEEPGAFDELLLEWLWERPMGRGRGGEDGGLGLGLGEERERRAGAGAGAWGAGGRSADRPPAGG